jgi:hypothetical protein
MISSASGSGLVADTGKHGRKHLLTAKQKLVSHGVSHIATFLYFLFFVKKRSRY